MSNISSKGGLLLCSTSVFLRGNCLTDLKRKLLSFSQALSCLQQNETLSAQRYVQKSAFYL